MKRGCSNFASTLDEEGKARLKHQNLLEEYLELQKEFVSKKRKLEVAKQKRASLVDEVRFLRQRYRYLSMFQSSNSELNRGSVEAEYACIGSESVSGERNFGANGATMESLSRPDDLNPTTVSKEGEGSIDFDAYQILRAEKMKPCLINGRKAGKKRRISWQDQMVLKV